MTACWSVPRDSGDPASSRARAGPMPSARSRSVVGQKQHVGAGAAEQLRGRPAVRWVAWTAVVRGPRAPSAVEQLGRGHAVEAQAGVVLGRLLGEVHVQRQALGGRGPRRRCRSARHRPHRVDRRTDAHPPASARSACDPALGPALDGAVAEPALPLVQRGVPVGGQPAGEVARVQQGDPEPGLRGRLAQRLAHRVRVVVRRAARPVVQVVELADAGDAGERHLGVRRPGQREVGVRVEPRGDGVHALAPGPERAAAAVRAAAQGAVEGVRVRVGEAGQHQPGQPFVVAGGAVRARPR